MAPDEERIEAVRALTLKADLPYDRLPTDSEFAELMRDNPLVDADGNIDRDEALIQEALAAANGAHHPIGTMPNEWNCSCSFCLAALQLMVHGIRGALTVNRDQGLPPLVEIPA